MSVNNNVLKINVNVLGLTLYFQHRPRFHKEVNATIWQQLVILADFQYAECQKRASPWAADFPSLYQIWCKNVDPGRNYGPKSKSKMAAVRHLEFSKT